MALKKNKKTQMKSSNVPVSQSVSSPSLRNRNAPLENLMDRFWDRDLFSERSFEKMGLMDRSTQRFFIQPRSDFWENKKEVGLSIDVPGVDKKDIQLNITNNTIEIRAEKRNQKEDTQNDLYRMERSYSGFYRSFTLPSNVDPSKAHAKYENGVLNVILPKSPEKSSRKASLKVH